MSALPGSNNKAIPSSFCVKPPVFYIKFSIAEPALKLNIYGEQNILTHLLWVGKDLEQKKPTADNRAEVTWSGNTKIYVERKATINTAEANERVLWGVEGIILNTGVVW